MMKRSGIPATIVAAAVLCSSVALRAQEPSSPQEQTQQEQSVEPAQEPAVAPAQEQAISPQEQIVEAPQRIVAAEEPAAAPVEQPVEAPQRVVASEEPAAEPATEEAGMPAQEAAVETEEPVIETEEPVIEEPKFVRFVNINDALPTRFFHAAATAPDPADPNTLVIGLHTDTDRATWKNNHFRASTAAFSHLSAIDTISFRVEAPKGQRIAKITYTQNGTGSVIRVAKASGATHWVVGDYAAQIGIFGANPSVKGEAEFSTDPRESVDVSITTGLFVFAAPTSGAASLEVTSAVVQVDLVPAPDGL
jgi:hypothetical protein